MWWWMLTAQCQLLLLVLWYTKPSNMYCNSWCEFLQDNLVLKRTTSYTQYLLNYQKKMMKMFKLQHWFWFTGPTSTTTYSMHTMTPFTIISVHTFHNHFHEQPSSTSLGSNLSNQTNFQQPSLWPRTLSTTLVAHITTFHHHLKFSLPLFTTVFVHNNTIHNFVHNTFTTTSYRSVSTNFVHTNTFHNHFFFFFGRTLFQSFSSANYIWRYECFKTSITVVLLWILTSLWKVVIWQVLFDCGSSLQVRPTDSCDNYGGTSLKVINNENRWQTLSIF